MSRTLVKSIRDVLAEMATTTGAPQLVADWKKYIPSWSRWHPGDPGDPNCRDCEGTGYVRLEGLPVNHPYFGKILFCHCAEHKVREWDAHKAAEGDAEQVKMPSYQRR
jgi:hypothetical protein